jgi:hypothetical protein
LGTLAGWTAHELRVLRSVIEQSAGAREMSRASRSVLVNMKSRGRTRELNCRWLNGVLNAYPELEARYQWMPANKVPSGKKHCSHC